MTSLNILDTPFEIQTTNIITSFNVEIINIILFTSATIRVVQYDINLNIIRVDNLTISGEDYANWTSDQYLITWVKTQLNFN
jgi:hypothetical protein